MKFLNSLKRNIEDFAPDKKQIGLYSCGPTVYDTVHIGNLRAFLFTDVLYKSLSFFGYDTKWVMNITDVDDKTIAKTVSKFGESAGPAQLREYTDFFYEDFLAALKKVNIGQSQIKFVKVTDHISDIQEFILKLMDKGFAYKADDGSTYFSIERYQAEFGDYGALSGEKFLQGKKIGARVAVDEYDKENLSDFALWKAQHPSDGQIFWDHPILGKGRPGWHIECTVINSLEFPNGTDIHTGGIDLLFPHHTNEIAQAQPVYKPFVKTWLHSEHILVENKKMSKSAGNFFTINDLEKENICDGLDLRFLVLQSHYRSQINITKQSLESARSGLKNLRMQIGGLIKNSSGYDSPDSQFLEKFKLALAADLNTPAAMALVNEILKSSISNEQKLSTIFEMDKVFGLDLENTYISEESLDIGEQEITPELKKLMEQRISAKNSKNYELADKLRKQIEEQGYELLDTAQGQKLRKK